jgi:uncharacterized phiE125 gp8 family phage protein
MWRSAKVTSPPSAEPISLDDAKRQCRIGPTDTNFDVELGRLSKAARDHVESYCGMRFAEWAAVMECDSFADFVALPEAPLKAITSVAYTDLMGDEQTLDPSVYGVGGSRFAPSITLNPGQVWPQIEHGSAIVVSATVGGDVPESVGHAMLIFVSDSFHQRENAKAENWTVLDYLLCNHRRGSV